MQFFRQSRSPADQQKNKWSLTIKVYNLWKKYKFLNIFPLSDHATPLSFFAFLCFCLTFLSLSVITGKVTSLTTGPRGSATVEVSLIKAYKAGRLNITKSGPVMSVILTSTCKKCPGLTKGMVQLSVSYSLHLALYLFHICTDWNVTIASPVKYWKLPSNAWSVS